MVNDGRSLLVFFLFIFSVDYMYTEDIATGTNYTFRPSIKGTIESLNWRHNGNWVVDWDSGKEPLWYRYKERARLDTKTGDFTLQLNKEDSGVFKGQFQVNGVLQYSESTITVIDPISDPKVTCEQNDTSITLLCSVDPPVQAEFKWSGPNTFSQSGNSVHITKGGGDNSVYYCTAKNIVSEKTTEFNLNKCTTKGGQGGQGGHNIGAIVGGVFGVLFLIGLVLAGVFWKKIKDWCAGSPDGATGEMEGLKAGTTSEPKSNGGSDQPSNDHNNTDC